MDISWNHTIPIANSAPGHRKVLLFRIYLVAVLSDDLMTIIFPGLTNTYPLGLTTIVTWGWGVGGTAGID